MPLAYGQPAPEALADPQLLFRDAFETLPLGGRAGDRALDRHRQVSPSRPFLFGEATAPSRKASAWSRCCLRCIAQRRPGAATAGNPPRRDPTKPLAGVRVLDLANTWAGPRGTMLLGDLGAEVMKLDGVEWMDVLRGFTAPPAGSPSYPRGEPGDRPWDRYIMWLGGPARNKRSLAAELTRPEARAILDELVAIADVVVTNMSASTRAKHRLDYEALAAINPSIIYAVLSGYGDEGPRSAWRLFGDGQASMAALFAGTGYEGGEPVPLGTIGDRINGTALAFHVVQALLLRERSGSGMFVDVSAVESCLSYAVRSFVEAQTGRDSAANVGVDAQGRWPHGVFRCLGEDRWVTISCGSDDERLALTEALAGLGIACDGLSLTGDGTEQARSAWETLLGGACREREAETLEHALRWRGVPCQKVMRPRDIDGDAILASRGFLTWLWREDLGSYPAYSPAWLIDARRPAITHAPPRLGQDNDYVLGELLGKQAAIRADLRARGVVGDTPVPDAELGVRSLTATR